MSTNMYLAIAIIGFYLSIDCFSPSKIEKKEG